MIDKIKLILSTSFTRKVIFSILFILIFVFIYDLNLLYPLFADDWDYSYYYWQPYRISNFFQVFGSQAVHYVKWGGRLVLHGILQELLFFGPFWSDLLNSLMFVLYIFVMYKMANFKNKIRLDLIIIYFLLIWFFQVNLGETVLWLSGSANYLWGTTIVLLYMYFFCAYSFNKGDTSLKENRIIYFLFFLFGIIAGWTNENMAIALICIIVFFLFFRWKQTRTVPIWGIWGSVGVLIGMTMMYLAPGNYVRYQLRLKALGISNPPPVDFYIENFYNWLNLNLKYLSVLIIIYLLLVGFFWFSTKRVDKKDILIRSLLFFISALIATGVLVVAPEFSDRMLFGVISLILVSIGIVYVNIDLSKFYLKYIVSLLLIGGYICFFNSYKEGRDYLVYINNIVKERENQIQEQKAIGITDVILKTNTFQYRADLKIPRMIDLPIENESDNWLNIAFCRYHGIRSKVILPPDNNQ